MGSEVNDHVNSNIPMNKDIFDSEKTIKEHVTDFSQFPEKYVSAIDERVANKLNTTSSLKARILIAAWIISHGTDGKKRFDDIWSKFEMTTGDIFKFVQLLDAPREARALKTKLDHWKSKKLQVRASKVTCIENRIKELSDDTHSGNLTSSMAKRLKKWVGTIPSNQLDFYILNYPETMKLWKQLADLCHLAEKDFQNPYFLSVIFGKDIPHDSRLYALKNINTDNFVDSVRKYPDFTSCYSYLRQQVKNGKLKFTPANSKEFARTAPLSDILWFYEELQCTELDDMIMHRLDSGESFTTGGDDRAAFPAKLIERILMLQKKKKPFADKLIKYAEERLSSLRMTESKDRNIAILGDCSASMSVAVETASIVSGLLSVGLKADLVFFNNMMLPSPLSGGKAPSDVKEVLHVARAVSANSATSPAIALKHFYDMGKKKEGKVIDMFIVVTDEEENTPCSLSDSNARRGWSYTGDGVSTFDFAQLFKKYRDEVNRNAQVMFISFLQQSAKGEMVTRLPQVIPDIKIRQYRLDGHLPDLSKFSELLGVVSMALQELPPRSTPVVAVETTTQTDQKEGDGDTKEKVKNKKNKKKNMHVW